MFGMSQKGLVVEELTNQMSCKPCLLYTSDAADEMD